MKTFLKTFGLLLLFNLNTYAQDSVYQFKKVTIDTTSGFVVFDAIIKLDSVGKEEIYNRIKIWLTEAFKSSKDVIQIDDKTSGRIICKGNSDIIIPMVIMDVPINCRFTLSILIKDFKYRVRFERITYQGYPDSYSMNPPINTAEDLITDKAIEEGRGKIKMKYRTATIDLLNTLLTKMQQSTRTKSVSDDW